jgi:outer membrane protein assembly factor BamD
MRFRFWVAAAALSMAGCTTGNAHLERLQPDALLDRGNKAMQAHKWDDAIASFDRLTIQYPSDSRVQEARYNLAESYFGKHEYVTAAGEFDRLANDYPTGTWADKARFGVCRAYGALSPVVALDQTYTISAIDHCKSLIAYYPNSPYVADATRVIGDLTEKLAQKALLAGEFYLRRHAYDSSLIYFEEVLKQYPKSAAAAQALLDEVRAYEKLGYTEDAKSARERLLREYPSSPAAKTLAATSQANS